MRRVSVRVSPLECRHCAAPRSYISKRVVTSPLKLQSSKFMTCPAKRLRNHDTTQGEWSTSLSMMSLLTVEQSSWAQDLVYFATQNSRELSARVKDQDTDRECKFLDVMSNMLPQNGRGCDEADEDRAGWARWDCADKQRRKLWCADLPEEVDDWWCKEFARDVSGKE